jgi:hypothetical protein
MELEGSLKAFSLPEVLQFLSMGKMTGALTIQRAEYNISLIIRQGKIVNSSTLDRPRKLGQMLVHRGVIKRSDLDEVLSLQKAIESDKLLGQILIERGLITKETLREAIKLQLEEEIWDLFNWDEGYFKFEHMDETDVLNILVELEIEPLLIEGTRRLDEWDKIIKNIQDDDTVVTVTPLSEEFEQEITLSDNEWLILSLINGFFNVGSLINRGGLGKFETYRILNSFLASGLVKVKEAGQEQRAAPSPPPLHPSEGENEKPQRSKKVGTIFSRMRQQPRERPEEAMTFVSPLGLIAHFVNELTAQLMQNHEFTISRSDETLLQRFWENVVMNYPKADLIRVIGNHVDVGAFERFVEFTALGTAIRVCYEDAIEAMAKLLEATYKLAAQRLGEKNVTRMIMSLRDSCAQKAHIMHADNFNLSDFVARVMT